MYITEIALYCMIYTALTITAISPLALLYLLFKDIRSRHLW